MSSDFVNLEMAFLPKNLPIEKVIIVPILLEIQFKIKPTHGPKTKPPTIPNIP